MERGEEVKRRGSGGGMEGGKEGRGRGEKREWRGWRGDEEVKRE